MATRTRAVATACGAAAAIALLAGCTGDPTADPPAGDGPLSASSSGEDGGGATSDGVTSSATSSASPTPTVAPAAGGQISTPLLTMRFPEEWTVSRASAPSVYGARSPDIWDTIHYSTIDLIGPRPLREVADLFSDPIGWDAPPQRLPTVTVDGVRLFHLRGKQGGHPREVYGTQRDTRAVVLEFEIREPRGRQRTIESVLASVDWKPL